VNERGRVLGYRNLSELRRRLEPVMLRRDRSLVRAQLPDRIQQQLDVPLDATQQDLHDEALATAGNIARRARKRPLTPIEEQMLMAALQRTRMACDAAGLVDGETVGSPKLDELGRILEDLCVEAGRKVVVFSQWERMTAMAEQRVRDLGLGCVRLHGGVPTARRGDLLDRFRDDPEVAVFLSTDAGGVGLNLQAASALVNLDMPWNPAVLEQRIARVHRLGQPEVVNVLLLLAADSYEQKVAAAVASKQFLFDNVVDPEATEDVVGMSKRMIETALVSLGDEEQAAPGVEAAGEAEPGEAELDELEEPEVAEAAEVEVVVEAEPAEVMEADEPEPAAQVEPLAAGLPEDTLAPVVVRLQEVLGSRIERLLAAGAGLVVVVDVVDPAAEKAVAGLGTEFPVEVVDRRTAAALSRLGALSGRSVDLPAAPSGPPPLLGLARRKLDAGELMVEQGFTAEAAELMTMAMLAAASHRAGLDAPIAAEGVAVWAYGEAVPRGRCSADDAAALTRAAALARAPEVPDPLLQLVAADARRLVGVEEAVA